MHHQCSIDNIFIPSIIPFHLDMSGHHSESQDQVSRNPKSGISWLDRQRNPKKPVRQGTNTIVSKSNLLQLFHSCPLASVCHHNYLYEELR